MRIASAILISAATSVTCAQVDKDTLLTALHKDIAKSLEKKPGQFIPDPVLNAFFNLQVGRYLSTSGDLTVARGFAILDNANDRLTIGGQFTNNASINSVTRLVFSGGLGSNIKNGFATVFKNGKEQNDLGVFLKGTFIFNGCLTLGTEGRAWTVERGQRIDDIIRLQEIAAKKAAKSWVEALRAEEDTVQVKRTAAELNKDKKNRSAKLIGDLSRAAAKQVEEKKPYRSTHSGWVSVEGFVPFSPTNFYTVDSVTAGLWNTHELRACEGKINLTYLFTNRYVGTIFLTAWGGYLNNNNILSKQLSTTAASQNAPTAQGDTLALVQLDGQETVGIGQYARFETYKLGGRGVWMFLPWMGVSAEAERWFGDYEPVNWKLGIPFAFKNEKGDRAINFEVQWREQLNVHSVGLSVGVPFGAALYK